MKFMSIQNRDDYCVGVICRAPCLLCNSLYMIIVILLRSTKLQSPQLKDATRQTLKYTIKLYYNAKTDSIR